MKIIETIEPIELNYLSERFLNEYFEGKSVEFFDEKPITVHQGARLPRDGETKAIEMDDKGIMVKIVFDKKEGFTLNETHAETLKWQGDLFRVTIPETVRVFILRN